MEASPESGDTGYLGPTSFSIFLQETQTSLSHLQGRNGSDAGSMLPPAAQTESMSTSLRTSFLSRKWTAEIAIHVLQSIPDRDLARVLIQKDFNPNDGWARGASTRMLNSLWDTFGTLLDGPRHEGQMMQMAQSLHQNSAQLLEENQTDPDEWLASFLGANLRWEALGIMFVYWAAGTESLPDDDDLYRSLARMPALNKRQLFARYHESIRLCVQLCGRPCGGNTLLLFLLLKNAMLTNISHGDASESAKPQPRCPRQPAFSC